ncbi:MAG: hypothetical protein IT210_10600 [Armatimonadetes bacterium]|nr:hypothetical protein [Armatimonadota bacterium]
MLEEQVVFALKVDQSVRVVQPVLSGSEVKLGVQFFPVEIAEEQRCLHASDV